MSVDGSDWHSNRPINKYAAQVEYDGKSKEYDMMAPPKHNAAESRIWEFHEFTRRDIIKNLSLTVFHIVDKV